MPDVRTRLNGECAGPARQGEADRARRGAQSPTPLTVPARMTDDSAIVVFGGQAKERPYPGATTVA
ncbi:hypothetical protein ABT052_47940, partial [Streptomyces sp. NPDC002766]